MSSVVSRKDRINFILARVVRTSNGPLVEPLKSKGSADLAAASKADGIVVMTVGAGEIPVNCLIEYRPWKPLY